LPSKFRYVKIPRNKLGTVIVIPQLIPRNSVRLGIAYSEVRNRTERNEFRRKMRFDGIDKITTKKDFSFHRRKTSY
jgi:hypothetical protein